MHFLRPERVANLTEPRPVEVLHIDGRWYPGMLDRWKHDDRGWVGHVWWSEGPGLTHVEWIKAERLRLAPNAGDDENAPPEPEL